MCAALYEPQLRPVAGAADGVGLMAAGWSRAARKG